MTSFINMMANDVWSDVDIVHRTEAMIASEFSTSATAILNRKVTAATIGQYTLTEAEQLEIARYAQVCHAAAAEGIEARKDMALLQSALNYEKAHAVVTSANKDTLTLVALRAPAPAAAEPATKP